jgi:DNA-binding GntR family transcriptional regulator
MPAGLGNSRGHRQLLHQQAYEVIRNAIVQSDLPPGSVVSERTLSEQFGFGRAPIRAAIQRLAAEGFLLIVPQQGIIVASPSLEEVRDLFELRVALESYVVRRLALEPQEVDFVHLELLLEKQEKAAQEQNIRLYRQLDVDFHLFLAHSLGNSELYSSMERLSDRLHRIIASVISRRPARMIDSTIEHRAIVQAIATGDPDAAEMAMITHLDWAWNFLTGGHLPRHGR